MTAVPNRILPYGIRLLLPQMIPNLAPLVRLAGGQQEQDKKDAAHATDTNELINLLL